MAFGERLQEVRRAAGLTQEQFAEELNVSRQAVSRWESCRGYPEMEKLLYLCNRYGVTLNQLFSEEVPLGEADIPAGRNSGISSAIFPCGGSSAAWPWCSSRRC